MLGKSSKTLRNECPEETGMDVQLSPENCPDKVGITVQIKPVRVSSKNRNQCPLFTGTGVQLVPEYAVYEGKVKDMICLT